MCWIFDVKIVALKDTCSVGGGPAMNMIITRVPVLNGPESAPAESYFDSLKDSIIARLYLSICNAAVQFF